MHALIAKARTASDEQLMEMAMILNGATDKAEMTARAAVTVVLEERLSADEFDAFFAALDA
ncbi:hypothetical protein HF263_03035 [Rhizobium leguminosarum]|uniref:hypothetical protein n=1 Tax=Rhizobium leguminosarum TaxID=384 RepID=UPI001C90774E|nr:hypothetical protein [Rhizobium leguminosarum]MBY3055053.1 hypothetical protein [Rhizobium leguminosarum]